MRGGMESIEWFVKSRWSDVLEKGLLGVHVGFCFG